MMQNERMISRLMRPVYRFMRLDYAAGAVLACSVLLAVLWANSPFKQSYHHFWELELFIGFDGLKFSRPLHSWINDGLMAVFFFVIGLELKRELQEGELSSLRKAGLPVMAALGGMLLPALLYFLMNAGTPAGHGWGIPMATDIAFALALLAVAGKHLPPSLKVFLSALAVADDLGAVLVIAFFYSSSILLMPLSVAAGFLLVIWAGKRMGIRSVLFYLLTGTGVWAGFLLSGVHATIAGVLVAFMVPSSARMEHSLQPWVGFVVMPLFALCNAGLVIGKDVFTAVLNPVSGGVVLGLVAGKFAGVLGFTWLMVRTGLASLPAQAGWKHIAGVALLAGVGFTMSLFISNLAFEDIGYMAQARYGILLASVISGAAGVWWLKRTGQTSAAPDCSGSIKNEIMISEENNTPFDNREENEDEQPSQQDVHADGVDTLPPTEEDQQATEIDLLKQADKSAEAAYTLYTGQDGAPGDKA